ncbi:hypothetical protein GGR51DRAFT_78122 [Nemania sp. FL0031]|nr:hypothetical protein GGR51DRAFT_78122 [Nemania sp. FL0031]
MAQIYRERDIRYTRDRSPASSDDERKYKTISTYKVGGPSGTSTRLERVDLYDQDDDRYSRHSHSHVGRPDVIEVDRRTERTVYPDRPRSAIDVISRGSESFRGDGDRLRTVEYEREVERDRDYYMPERRSRTRVVEETRDVVSPGREHYWERRRPWDDRETDLRLEKRVVRRDSDGDVKVKEKSLDIYKDKHHHHDEPREYKDRDIRIERRYVEDRDPRDAEVERYHRETEYYTAPDPPPAPIVMRQKMPEQKVIINEAPHPAPVIIPRADPAFIVLREGNREPRRDDEYYRRHEERPQESRSYDEDYYIKRTVIHRDRSSSSDHHKKRHIAEGALAGAGLGALVGGRSKDGESSHKGRKVLAGAALGALGTEVIRRARSAYEDRHDEYDYEYDDRRNHRSRSKSRSRLATGLAIGAAALAVAGGLKYMQNNKIEKEEAHRGRRRRRYSDDGYSRYSLSRSSSRHSRSRSKSNVAKAGAATAAIAGLVHHYRSKSRSKTRSKSRLRTGAEIAAAGLTGAAATKLWEHHKDKKNRERELSGDEYSNRDRSISRSRSRSRSLGRHHHSRDPTADRELGLVRIPDVEYGSEPLEPYDSPTEEARRHRHKHGHRSTSGSDREVSKKRSRSTLRDVAAAGLGTAAAAIGIKKYADHKKSKDRGDRSREGSLGQSRSQDRSDRARDRRSRDRERRRYEEAAAADPYYSGYDVEAPPPSPPHASGGFPPPPVAPIGGFTQHPNQSTANLNSPIPPYNPQDYANRPTNLPTNLPPPPPGPPPSQGYFPPPGGPGHHPGPNNMV